MRYIYSLVEEDGNGGRKHWKLNVDGEPSMLHIHENGTWDFKESDFLPSAIFHAQDGYVWLESYSDLLYIRRGGADRQVPKSRSSERKLVMLDTGEVLRIDCVNPISVVLEIELDSSSSVPLHPSDTGSEPQMFNTCPEAVESFQTTPPDTIFNTATQVGASPDRNNKKQRVSTKDEVISSTPPDEFLQPLTKEDAPTSISQAPLSTHHKALLIPETSVESSGLSEPPSTLHPPSNAPQIRASAKRKQPQSPRPDPQKTNSPSSDPLQPSAKKVKLSPSDTPVIVCSGVSGRALTALKGLVKLNVVRQVDSLIDTNATHLVFGEGKFRRNAKALLAIAGGQCIVSDAWILDSKRAGEMVAVDDYLVQNAHIQNKDYFLPRLTERYRSGEARFLQDQCVYVSEDTRRTWRSRGVLEQMQELLQLLGATIADARRDAEVVVTYPSKDMGGQKNENLIDPEDLYDAVLAGGMHITNGRKESA